jgi:hypothetical protein
MGRQSVAACVIVFVAARGIVWATPAPPLSVPNCTFDPLTDVPPGCPPFDGIAALQTDAFPSHEGVDYWLAQRDQALDPSWEDSLTDSIGNPAKVINTFKVNAVLVTVTDGSTLTTSDPTISWSGQYRPSFKVDHTLAPSNLASAVDETGLVPLVAVFHPSEDARAYESEIATALGGLALGGFEIMGTVAADWPGAEEGRGAFFMRAEVGNAWSAVEVLAEFEAVSSISTWLGYEPTMNEAVWKAQTSVDRAGVGYDVAAKLFARGLDGRGQVMAQLDRGFLPFLKGSCGLRYGPNDSDDPALPADVPATSTVTAPPHLQLENKVVAHYILRPSVPNPPCDPYPRWTQFWAHGQTTLPPAVGDGFIVSAARAGVSMDDPTDDEEEDDPQPAPDATAACSRPVIDTCLDDEDTRLVDHHQDLDGHAPGAQVIIQDFNPPNPEEHDPPGGPIFEIDCLYNFENVLQQAYSTLPGPRIHANAWGARRDTVLPYPSYEFNEQSYDRFAWRFRDFLPLFSAGNEGGATTPTLRREAGLKNGLAVGKIHAGLNFTFGGSSRGPGYRNRLKPDICAIAEVNSTVNSGSWPEARCIPDGSGRCINLDEAYTCCGEERVDFTGLVTSGGTSTSCPVAGAMGILIRQYFVDGYYPGGAPRSSPGFNPTNALVKALLINTTRDIPGATSDDGDAAPHAARPTLRQGWGEPVLDDSLYFAGDPTNRLLRGGELERSGLLVLADVPNGVTDMASLNDTRVFVIGSTSAAITTGVIHEYPIEVSMAATAPEALHVTLTWSDAPGNPAFGPTGNEPLVNDLDLEVVAPDGKVWRGNPGVDMHDPTRTWLTTTGYCELSALPCPATCVCIGPTESDVEQSSSGFCDFQTRDRWNNVENVFIDPAEVLSGPYRVRVIGFDVPGNGAFTRNVQSFPNLVDSDGSPDYDIIDGRRQGYALVASGSVASAYGSVHFDHSVYACGDEARVLVKDSDVNAASVVTVTTPLGDCDEFSLSPTAGPTFEWSSPPFVIADVTDALPGTCPGDGVVVTTDDASVFHPPFSSPIRATYQDFVPSLHDAEATASVHCRNVHLRTPVVLDDNASCAGAQAGDGKLALGEIARLEIFLENTQAYATGDLVGKLYPFDEHVEVVPVTPDPTEPTSCAISDMPGVGASAEASWLVRLSTAQDRCIATETLRFRFEIQGPNGFFDRIYFGIEQKCEDAPGVPAIVDLPEVPRADDVPNGVQAMRVTRVIGTNDLFFTWSAVAVADSYALWQGHIGSLVTGYDHRIDATAGARDLPLAPLLYFLNGAAAWRGGPEYNYYFLMTAEQCCSVAGANVLQHGSFGYAAHDRDGIDDPSERRPEGIMTDASCP